MLSEMTRTAGGSLFGMCSSRLATSPMPSSSTKMPGGFGARIPEAERLAYADRDKYVADTDFVPVPVEGLIAPDYLARRSALIQPGSTLPDVKAGSPEGAPQALCVPVVSTALNR